MKFSKFFIPTMIENPANTDNNSQRLMLKAGMIKQVSSGLFVYLPTFMRVAEKVIRVINEKMAEVSAMPVKFPILVAKEDLLATGRWESFGKEMFTLEDRNKKEYAISPTNEEYACFMASNFIKSYNDLPFCVYQIQQKHRDEIRPRGGVMRAREFIMKDAYSFHANEKDLGEYYKKMEKAYKEIFTELGINFAMVNADSGAMGGSGSHEFMAVCENGESEIATCECGFGANLELLSGDICPVCKKKIKVLKGNEIGHIFKLGTRYTDKLNLTFLDENNTNQILLMGCYGIGIERVISSIIEQHCDEKGIAWPEKTAPFLVNIITVNINDEIQRNLSNNIYEILKNSGVEVLWDDRKTRFGVKLADSELIGIPFNIIVGKNAENGKIEFQKRLGEKKLIEKNEILSNLCLKSVD